MATLGTMFVMQGLRPGIMTEKRLPSRQSRIFHTGAGQDRHHTGNFPDRHRRVRCAALFLQAHQNWGFGCMQPARIRQATPRRIEYEEISSSVIPAVGADSWFYRGSSMLLQLWRVRYHQRNGFPDSGAVGIPWNYIFKTRRFSEA